MVRATDSGRDRLPAHADRALEWASAAAFPGEPELVIQFWCRSGRPPGYAVPTDYLRGARGH
jgi:hypothetical protein